ncbi:MAG: GNAT family N-acetyltransferase [Candidatus Hadarchaeum sp.]|uniref:GNAT family N-acetyltransferase n=1 Tax=Candidatus Hadarchaeum sp. TaxID=2883567 RepID=UPI003D0BFE21
MLIVRYSPERFREVLPLLREGTRGWGKEWREEIIRSYSRSEGEAYLAEADAKVVGTLLLKREVRALVIYFLAVRKGERLKNIGSSLVKFAEGIARREKRILRVDVAKEFEKNANFYLKLGFKKCGRVKNFYLEGDDQIFLYKRPRR